jgi:hypothetical protein
VASHNIAVRYVEQRCESVTTRQRVRLSGQG